MHQTTKAIVMDMISLQQCLQFEEFVYKLNTVVNLCECELDQNSQKLAYSKDRMLAKMEAEVYTSVGLANEIKHIKALTTILESLEELERRMTEDSLKLAFIHEQVSHLKRQFQSEFKSFDIANTCLVYVIPLMKKQLALHWHPFESSQSDEACRLAFSKWKTAFESDHQQKRSNQMEPYQSFIWHAWVPAIQEIISKWSCKASDCMITLLESWEPLLVDCILEYIVDHLILPKLEKQINDWDPLTNDVPFHLWVLPWLPRLGLKLKILYPAIRRKMGKALVNWTPSDESARSLLLPWVPVFSKSAMDSFLVQNILPKLRVALMNWSIKRDPEQLDVWQSVMSWKDLIVIQHIVRLLINHFFLRWFHVLVMRLNNDPNYDEIVDWYMKWKSLFPAEIAQHPEVQNLFLRALDLMNRSLAANDLSDLIPLPVPIMPSVNESSRLVSIEPDVPYTLRELIEYRCSQLGILCIPLVNRFQAGRPIFRVGNVLSYFDHKVAFVFVDNAWTPVSLKQLLAMALS